MLSVDSGPVYQPLLTRRYLTSKVMPWLATLAVAACCALTLTTWSIMGGFLNVFLAIGKKMNADVSVTWPTAGFPYYEDLIARLEADPAVQAAAPMIRTFGMISLPDDRAYGVQISGVDERYQRVVDYAAALWWKPIDRPVPGDREREDPRLDAAWSRKHEKMLTDARVEGKRVEVPVPGMIPDWATAYQDGLTLSEVDPRTGARVPAAVLGIELGGLSQRKAGIWYAVPDAVMTRRSDGTGVWQSAFMPGRSVVITVLPLDKTGRGSGRGVATESLRMPVANEFRTGFYTQDQESVLVNLSGLQRMLGMQEGEYVEPPDPFGRGPAGGVATGTGRRAPAKVTTVLVKGRPGVGMEEVRQAAIRVYGKFAAAHDGEVPTAEQMERARGITNWDKSVAMFIGQVKKETAIILGILLFISLVCSLLILSIFWSMVSEKTKDVGILRAVGCSRAGVAWIWLRYGVAIGALGALLGLALATAIVWNINPIHAWLGSAFGVSVWDPSVYLLPEIPNEVETSKALIVGGFGLLLSVLGALIPAVRAANMDPVRALRFE